jgi:hypothetical protein
MAHHPGSGDGQRKAYGQRPSTANKNIVLWSESPFVAVIKISSRSFRPEQADLPGDLPGGFAKAASSDRLFLTHREDSGR